jgi:hypothetical protein
LTLPCSTAEVDVTFEAPPVSASGADEGAASPRTAASPLMTQANATVASRHPSRAVADPLLMADDYPAAIQNHAGRRSSGCSARLRVGLVVDSGHHHASGGRSLAKLADRVDAGAAGHSQAERGAERELVVGVAALIRCGKPSLNVAQP